MGNCFSNDLSGDAPDNITTKDAPTEVGQRNNGKLSAKYDKKMNKIDLYHMGDLHAISLPKNAKPKIVVTGKTDEHRKSSTAA